MADLMNSFQASDFHGIKGFSLHMWIPQEAVGKVIGKRGAVITHIQLTTQTEVVVLTLEHADLWAPVIITGEPYKALQAYELIKDIVEEADDIVVEFPFPRQKIYHGLFYGNHHDAVKYLSADTNVRINVPDGHTTAHHQISLEGAAENVFRALINFAEVMVNPEFTSPKSFSSITALKSGQSSEAGGDCLSPIVAKDGSYELTAKIPCPIVGLLLIRRTTDPNIIHQIRQLTNTTILKVEGDSDTPEDKAHELEITEEKINSSYAAKFNPRGYEIFSVRGHKEADVILASSCLARIVEGEKIFSVMNELKMVKGGNTYRDDHKRDPFDAFSARGRGGRVARGRGTFGTSRGGHTFSSHSHHHRDVRSEVEESGGSIPRGDDRKDEQSQSVEKPLPDDERAHEVGLDGVGEEVEDEEEENGEEDRGSGDYVSRGRGGRRGGRTVRGRGSTGRAATRGRLRERGRGLRGGRRGTWIEE